MPRIPACLILAALLAVSACSNGSEKGANQDGAPRDGPLEGFVTVDRLPMPTDPRSIGGREVWAGTCQACHGLGEAGSPKITDKKAWAPRIAQGIDTLRQHALEGFIGPSGTMMPERGGNPDLTDEQIFAAIDYMVANSK
jgi:cytochrome c5